ncbi:ECs_2282 family putative zinc-binding protein [Psychrobacter frigidicola]|uniref:ECs_2282 family putative zinc-binding protein n=1 Tax=Psychrobacter frigidicola TaxID=45611 RepID=UPI00191ACE3A|nr:hypothetical protein [Psychrobacter frigidicola]
MSDDKHTRHIDLQCPTCGCTDYQYSSDMTTELVQCASCKRELTKDELTHLNSENIDVHTTEVKEELINDIANIFSKTFKNK